ncbi:hypothetical protein CR513_12502, partial [Mucuna pruriens]
MPFEFHDFDDFTNCDCTCTRLTKCPICVEISSAINEGAGVVDITVLDCAMLELTIYLNSLGLLDLGLLDMHHMVKELIEALIKRKPLYLRDKWLGEDSRGFKERPKLRMSQPNQERSDLIEASRPRRSDLG